MNSGPASELDASTDRLSLEMLQVRLCDMIANKNTLNVSIGCKIFEFWSFSGQKGSSRELEIQTYKIVVQPKFLECTVWVGVNMKHTKLGREVVQGKTRSAIYEGFLSSLP